MKYDTQKTSITSDMFNYTFKPKMEQKFQLFADYRFEYIHWCDDWSNEVIYSKQDIKKYSEILDACSIKCIDVHGTSSKIARIDSKDNGGLNKYIQLLKNRIEFCSAVGGDSVVIHPPNALENNNLLNQNLERSLHAFEDVKILCNDLNIKLAVENISAHSEIILKYYFERYPKEFVGFCYDSGHAHLFNNLNSLFQFNERLIVLHLHDNKGKTDAHQPPFWGTIDWEPIMNWIKEIGYSRPINFEITHRAKLFDGTMIDYLDYIVKQIQLLRS